MIVIMATKVCTGVELGKSFGFFLYDSKTFNKHKLEQITFLKISNLFKIAMFLHPMSNLTSGRTIV